MGRAGNPPSQLRSAKGKKGRSNRCILLGGGLAAAALLAGLAAIAVSSMSETVLRSVATDLASQDIERGIEMFQEYHKRTMQGVVRFRMKAFADFQEVWEAAGHAGRTKYMQEVQQLVQHDPLFADIAEGARGGSFTQLAPELFSDGGGFIAYDAEGFRSLLGALLQREENEGFSDDEIKKYRQLAGGEKADYYAKMVELRLAMRSLVMSKFCLMLGAEVLRKSSDAAEI